MPKHIEALKSLEDFRAPWETEGGADAEIDKPKLKRWLHGVLSDKAKAQDARDEALERVTAAEKERDEAKEDAAKASPEEANKKIAKLEKENGELKTKVTSLEEAKAEADLRADVLEGLDPKYAKYVQGKTRDELEDSLKTVKEDFGLTEDGQEGDGDGDGEGYLRTRPRSSLRNPIDQNAGKGGDKEIDFDKVAAEILGSGPFG